MNFFDADRLAGKDLTEVDFLGAQTDSAATGNHDRFVVERVVDVGQSLARLTDARWPLIWRYNGKVWTIRANRRGLRESDQHPASSRGAQR